MFGRFEIGPASRISSHDCNNDLGSGKVQRTAARFSAITASAGIAGHQAARRLLDSVGLHHVPVAPSTGPFGDYYDHANRECGCPETSTAAPLFTLLR